MNRGTPLRHYYLWVEDPNPPQSQCLPPTPKMINTIAYTIKALQKYSNHKTGRLTRWVACRLNVQQSYTCSWRPGNSINKSDGMNGLCTTVEWMQKMTYLSISEIYLVRNAIGVFSLSEAYPSKREPASTSFTMTCRAISPMYIPLIIFSYLYKQKQSSYR